MAETPKFWKNVQIFGVLICAVSGGLIAAPVEFSPDVQEFLQYILTVGGTLAGISQFAINDNGETGPKEN